MASPVEPLFAQWLQGEPLLAVGSSALMIDRWGDTAASSDRLTGLATRSGALAEAARQIAFLSRGPFAIDVHQLVGTDWHRALGCVVRLVIDQLGYDDGVDVFVIEAEPDRASGLSTVAVLRPLVSA